jgi:hypothetical protein
MNQLAAERRRQRVEDDVERVLGRAPDAHGWQRIQRCEIANAAVQPA